MHLTPIGALQIIIGLYLLIARRAEAMLAFTMACTLMGGSAALTVPALGNASIAPGQLAVVFLALRVFLHRNISLLLMPAIRQNASILIYALYGAVGACIFPRMFRNAINVVPMKPLGLRNLFDAFPLVPTSQNITSAVYITGTAVFALLVSIVVLQPRGATRFVKTGIIISWIHALVGIIGALGSGTWVQSVLSLFRNGNYAQVDQFAGGYARINGIMPEASTYASYGVFWFILMTELWLRNIIPRKTGPAAAILALVLVASTSSTAYVSLAGYTLVLVARLLLLSTPTIRRKAVIVTLFLLILIVASSFLILLRPALAESLLAIFEHMTVDKADSVSGQQRYFWAYQGLNAFVVSHGLGIGPGSFRSSSLVTAIIGSVGIIGSSAFLLYCFKVLKPFRTSTYFTPRDRVEATGVAASWAAILGLMPSAVSAPSPDPGLLFGLLAGVALGLRSLKQFRARPQSLHRLLALPDATGSSKPLPT